VGDNLAFILFKDTNPGGDGDQGLSFDYCKEIYSNCNGKDPDYKFDLFKQLDSKTITQTLILKIIKNRRA
jgi:hypothetical protein